MEDVNSSSKEVPISDTSAHPRFNQTPSHGQTRGKGIEPNVDQAKIKKQTQSRISAQNCRLRQAKHMENLEKNVKDIEETIALLKPQIEHEKEYQSAMRLENKALGEKLEILTEIDREKTAQTEETRAEINKLKNRLSHLRREKRELAMRYGIAVEEDVMEYSSLVELTSQTFYLENNPQTLARIGLESHMLDHGSSHQVTVPNDHNINRG